MSESETREPLPERAESFALAELCALLRGPRESMEIDLDQASRAFGAEFPGLKPPAVAEQSGTAVDSAGKDIPAELFDRRLCISSLPLAALEILHRSRFVFDQKYWQRSEKLLHPNRKIRAIGAIRKKLIVGEVTFAVAEGFENLPAESVDHRLFVRSRSSGSRTPIEVVSKHLSPTA